MVITLISGVSRGCLGCLGCSTPLTAKPPNKTNYVSCTTTKYTGCVNRPCCTCQQSVFPPDHPPGSNQVLIREAGGFGISRGAIMDRRQRVIVQGLIMSLYTAFPQTMNFESILRWRCTLQSDSLVVVQVLQVASLC
jgi:hypothetical protein